MNRDNFFNIQEVWRNSFTCNFSGVLATSSCILSNTSLLLMTIEKYFAITLKFQNKLINYFTSLSIFIAQIIISIFLSILPIYLFQVC